MEKRSHPNDQQPKLGFRYFPDSLHYRDTDLQTWLPALQALGARLVVLSAPEDRAIPEGFVRGLAAGGIEPVVQFRLPLAEPVDHHGLAVLLQAYASWGVTYVCPFDRPNTRQSWNSGGWVQQQLVERFLDRFVPLAEQICQAGMRPVFPGLEPGGAFWDTVFLRAALKGIKARGHTRLLEQLVIGAHANASGRRLDWGAGGPEVWTGVRPYDTPAGQEDHLGFRIFEWYAAISQQALGGVLPIMLLTASAEGEDDIREITRMLAGRSDTQLPEYVLGGCLDDLAAWHDADGSPLPLAAEVRGWTAETETKAAPAAAQTETSPDRSPSVHPPAKLIQHYLLLPHPSWGNPDWFLKVAQPYIKKYAPTTGYQVEEALLARQVTIVGGVQVYPENLKETLESAGCTVIQVSGSGTEIASRLTRL